MGLLNAAAAAAMWFRLVDPLITKQIKWGVDNQTCGGGPAASYQWLYYQGISSEPVSATLIGTDPDTCISYYHLTDLSASGMIRNTTASCFYAPFPGFPTTPGETVNTGTPGDDHGIAVFDAGSDASPYDGTKVINHTGYPVCAAFAYGGGDHIAFQAGEASTLTVAAARAACDSGLLSMCGGTLENLAILVKVD